MGLFLHFSATFSTFDESKDNEDERMENSCLSKSNQKKKKLQKNEGIVYKLNTIFESKKMNRSTKNSTNQDRRTPTVERKRCHKCFKAHFPLPKFCRWTKSYSVTKQSPLTKEDMKSKMKFEEPLKLDDYINCLELKLKSERLYQQLSFGDKFVLLFYLFLNGDMFMKKTDGLIEASETEDNQKSETSKYVNKDSYASICEKFLKHSTESASLENLYDDRYLMKLKGGGRKEKEELKIKKFISETKEINSVLNSLRSSAMFESLNLKHFLCFIFSDSNIAEDRNEFKTELISLVSEINFLSFNSSFSFLPPPFSFIRYLSSYKFSKLADSVECLRNFSQIEAYESLFTYLDVSDFWLSSVSDASIRPSVFFINISPFRKR